jgi:hypothetical protein
MGGLLQNEDFKTEAELVAAGGAKAQLLNEDKIYIASNSISETLDDAITSNKLYKTTSAPVGLSDTQSLSNKSISDALTFAEIATPANPAANKHKVYFKADGTMYTLNSAGTEVAVGAFNPTISNPATDHAIVYSAGGAWVNAFTNHQTTSGKQGGQANEYYHFTAAEHTAATQNASGSQSGLLSSADWTTFNGKQASGSYELSTNKSTDITLGGDTPSDTLYPSQAAVKSYTDSYGFTPNVIGTAGSPSLITAAGGIVLTNIGYVNVIFIAGNGAPITITANPQITAPTMVGQILIIISVSATNTVTINTGTGFTLSGMWVSGYDIMMLVSDGTNWCEMNRR